MITEGIIIALITGLCAVFGQYLIARKNRLNDAAERAKLDERTDRRLQILEKKLDEHNSYADKINEIKIDIAEIKIDMKNLKERSIQ